MKNRIVSRLAILACVFFLLGVMAACHAEEGGYEPFDCSLIVLPLDKTKIPA